MTFDWWTLGIQTVNVAVLVWLLQRFFWRPVAAMIEARRVTVRSAFADATATQTNATAALAEIETTRVGFAMERETILTEARASAEQARTAILADAATAAEELEATARVAIEKERQAAEAAWSDRSSRLAVEIAGRLAARLDGPAVQACFLDWLIKAIGASSDTERQATAFAVVSATALDPTGQEHVSGRIRGAFGADPVITFGVDPTLIAGLELHGPHLVISNSWRADLAKILKDLARGS